MIRFGARQRDKGTPYLVKKSHVHVILYFALIISLFISPLDFASPFDFAVFEI